MKAAATPPGSPRSGHGCEFRLIDDAKPRTVRLTLNDLGAGARTVFRCSRGQCNVAVNERREALFWFEVRIVREDRCPHLADRRSADSCLLCGIGHDGAFCVEGCHAGSVPCVVEEANFTRAAARVNISQSGISAQIRTLERELGAELIDRSNRVAALTVTGEAALGHARTALGAAAALRRAVDEVNSLVRGRIDVGMVTACTVTPLFDALGDFHGEFPGIDVSLAEGNSDELISRVGSGSLDVALVGTAGAPPEGLNSLVIVREGLAACVPVDHPLAAAAEVSLIDVCSHRVVCLPPGTGIRTVFDDACAARNVVADVALAASAPGAVADLAARGMGVGILSESMAQDFVENLVAVRISDVDMDALLALVWSDRSSRAVTELVPRVQRRFFG